MYKHTSLAEILKNAGLVNEDQADLTKQIADVDKAYKASQETDKPAIPKKPAAVSKPTTTTKPVEPVKKDEPTKTAEPAKTPDAVKKADEPVKKDEPGKSPADMFKAAVKPAAAEPEKPSLFKSLFKPDAADDAQVSNISKNISDRMKGFMDMAKGLTGGGSGQTNTFNVTQQQPTAPTAPTAPVSPVAKPDPIADLSKTLADTGTFDNSNTFTNKGANTLGPTLGKTPTAATAVEEYKDPATQTEDPANTKQPEYDEYQDSLLDILKIAGVPAEQRAAPDYEAEVRENENDNLEDVECIGGDASDSLIADTETNQRGTDSQEGPVAESALQGQYGHSGKLKPIGESPEWLTRLKELSGMIRN